MISTLWLIFMSFHQGQFFFKKNLAFASPDLVPKLTLKLSTRRTFEALSSSGPFQELITLTSNCKLWVVLGLYHLIFIKVFLYLRVWAQRYLILVLMGILQDQSFNDRVHLWSWGFTRDIILMRLAFASPNLQSSFKFWSFPRACNFNI